jgi:transposase-like protein
MPVRPVVNDLWGSPRSVETSLLRRSDGKDVSEVRKFEEDFRQGAVRLVFETGRPIAQVARLFAAHHGTYGSPRITADLREAGWRVSQNTVAALMREQQLAGRRPGGDALGGRPARPPSGA